jgi:hypothetical protein
MVAGAVHPGRPYKAWIHKPSRGPWQKKFTV